MALGKCLILPKRYVLAAMIFSGFFIMFSLRVNINVAIGAMVNNHTIYVNGRNIYKEAEFDWDTKVQGVVLGSFYYGYMLLQIPGGWLALKVGGTRLYGIAVFIASIVCLATPFAARWCVYALVALRVLQGLVLGVLFPCNHTIWGKWAPSGERTVLCSLAISGCCFGTIVTMPIAGLLSKYGPDGGWASVFYCFGVFGVVWYVFWLYFVYESPSCHPTITEEEREWLEKTTVTDSEGTEKSVPWRSILTSSPVIGIIVAAFASDWGLYVLLICVPLFLLDVMHLDIATMGFAAAAPFLVKAFSTPTVGLVADFVRNRKLCSTIMVRRVSYVTGTLTAGTMIVIAGYASNATMVVACMCFAGGATGMIYAGFQVNILDIAPRYAGIVMGISNSIGSAAGFLSPMLVGFITQNKTVQDWRTVFWLTLLLYIIGSVVFCALVSEEREEWDRGEPLPDVQEAQEKADKDGAFFA